MIKMIILGLTIILSGCDNGEPFDANQRKEVRKPLNDRYYKLCMENVVYLKLDRGLSVYIDPKTLKPMNCK